MKIFSYKFGKIYYSIWLPVILISDVFLSTAASLITEREEYGERKLKEFNLHLHHKVGNTRIRSIRALEKQSKYANHSPKNTSSQPTNSSIYFWSVLEIKNKEYLFGGLTDGSVIMFRPAGFISLFEYSLDEPIYDIVGFRHKNDTWLLGVHRNKKSSYIQFYKMSSNYVVVKTKQKIMLDGYSQIKIVDIENKIYLLITSDVSTHTELKLFMWIGTQFNFITHMQMEGTSQNLVVWKIESSLYVALNTFNKSVLEIMKVDLNSENRNFVAVQTLNQRFHVVKHFKVGNDQFFVCAAENKIFVYWWNGFVFLEQQEITSSDEKRIVDITVSGHTHFIVHIVVAKNNILEYYMQSKSVHLTRTDVIELPANKSIKSVKLFRSLDVFFLLPIFKENHPPSLYEVIFYKTKNCSSTIKISSLKGCIANIEKEVQLVNTNLKDIQADLNGVWMKTNSSFLSTVTVKGSIYSNEVADIEEISFNQNKKTLKLLLLLDSYKRLHSKTMRIKSAFEKTISKEKPQLLNGNFKFHSVKFVAMSIYNSLFHTRLNRIHTSFLTSALKKIGYQTFSANFTMKYGIFRVVDTHTINDIDVLDFILLNGNQFMTENFYFSKLFVYNMKADKLNGLDPNDFILSSSSQVIQGQKHLKNLLSESITIKSFLNDVNIRNFSERTVKIRNLIYNDFNVIENFEVLGDLSVNFLKGKNISHLIIASVKKNSNETITGKKIFLSPMKTIGISVLGSINHINLHNLFSLYNNQTIPGTIIFRKVLFKDIDTDLLNNVDLSEEAVVKSNFSFLKNKAIFLQPVHVSKIVMGSKSYINSLNLSEEAVNILTKNQILYINEFKLKNIIVNNVEIEDSYLKNILFHLENNILLKSKPQNISSSSFKMLSAQEIHAMIINKILLKDVILLNSNAEISSLKSFENVTAKSVLMRGRRNLFNLDETLFAENKLSFIFEEMIIFRNLYVSSFNNIFISDLMQVEKHQICFGEKFFPKLLMDHLSVHQLLFSKFHGSNFSNYISTALGYEKPILNTSLSHLRGSKFYVRGFLNGKNINKVFETVVVLNARQNISADLTFSDIFKTKVINLPFIIDLSSVVFKDISLKNILHKKFQGSFICGDLKLENKINNINITELNLNTFKSKNNNTMKETVIFKRNLTAPTIRISNELVIDGVSFAELIELTESIYFDSMKFSTINSQNVTALAQMNNCGTLLELFQLEMLKSDELKVNALKTFFELEIDGNLLIENTLNDVYSDEINIILSHLSWDEEQENVYLFYGISINSLKVLNPINEIDISFLLTDGIKQNVKQNIKGSKKFRTLFLNDTRSENLLSDLTCNVNLSLLQNSYVSKMKKKQFLFLSNLPKVSARNIVVEKRLNGIRLPQDVILTDKNERIVFPVFVKSTVKVSDLEVFGHIAGINISHLIKNRIVLSGSSTVFSNLIFMDNVTIYGDLQFEGFVNGLKLFDYTKKVGALVIHGRKTFEKLCVSNINLQRSINNNSIASLSESICKLHDFVNLTELAHFSHLKTSSFETDYLNGILIQRLWPSIHNTEKQIYGFLDNCSETIDHQNKHLNLIEDAIYYPLTVFTYFELHQSLNMGATIKMLPVYESGVLGDASDVFSLQLILWTIRNETCSNFKSFIMDIHPNGTLEKNANFSGKLYSFTLGFSEENVRGFMLHCNRKDRCREEDSENLIKTVYFNGDTYSNVISSPHTSQVVDVKFIEMDIGVYVLVAYSMNRVGERLYLYEHDSVQDSWSVLQKFHFGNVSSIDILLANLESHEIYLSIAGDGRESGLYLYEWDFENNLFENKLDVTQPASGYSLWVNIGRDIFLLFAMEKSSIQKEHNWIDTYTEPIIVYIFDTEFGDLIVNQTINIHGIYSMEQFKLDGETFVLAVSRHFQIIFVIQYRGINGFEVIQEINSPGVVDATIFLTPNNDLFLSVSSTSGHTRVLKSVIRGGSYFE